MSPVSQNPKPTQDPSRRDDLIVMLLNGGAATNAIARYIVDAFAAETVAERDTEIMRWLGKKAREYRSTSNKQDALRAETCTLMASKISRGAVRPNNTLLPARVEPTFFEPGREYRATEHADLRYRCLSVDAHPETGELRAFGWRFNARTGKWRPSSLNHEDWACCGWAEDGVS